jgi:hypothetical protein
VAGPKTCERAVQPITWTRRGGGFGLGGGLLLDHVLLLGNLVLGGGSGGGRRSSGVGGRSIRGKGAGGEHGGDQGSEQLGHDDRDVGVRGLKMSAQRGPKPPVDPLDDNFFKLVPKLS